MSIRLQPFSYWLTTSQIDNLCHNQHVIRLLSNVRVKTEEWKKPLLFFHLRKCEGRGQINCKHPCKQSFSFSAPFLLLLCWFIETNIYYKNYYILLSIVGTTYFLAFLYPSTMNDYSLNSSCISRIKCWFWGFLQKIKKTAYFRHFGWFLFIIYG